MEYNEVMELLKSYGKEQYIKTYRNHGADLDMFGVSMANLKLVLRKVKKDRLLGLKLLNSRNLDAMYLSRWLVDPVDLSKKDFERLINSTNFYMFIENVIPYIICKNEAQAFEYLEAWIDSDNSKFRQTAYAIYSLILASFSNDLIDEENVLKRINIVKNTIQTEDNRVKYTMNNFIISAGISLANFTSITKKASVKYGLVEVDVGSTSCKVPLAHSYIEKAEKMNKIGIKRPIKKQ